ncbi:MAG: hypothetical protein GWP15_03505 [Nitrospirae bacterium]|nr:hypothetical protein [Nitrospirota bacterium]
MFATSGDILNMSLAIGFILLVIFLCFLIFYAVIILRDAAKVMDDVEEVVTRVRTTIVQPLKAVDYIIEKAKPYVETVIERKMNEKKKSKKK